MSIKSRAAAIDFSDLKRSTPAPTPATTTPEAGSVGVPAQHVPKTGPGLITAGIAQQRQVMFDNLTAEKDQLAAQLAEYDGALPVRRLDPAKIRPSRWANRHDLSFTTPEFAALREEIASASGNVQPIKVRPVKDTDEYEIVFGHRRHRACLELGLPVLAMIEAVGDQALWAEMERENRQRADLSPWEQGVHYHRALEEGLFPSMRRLAEAVGLDVAYVSRVVAIAKLPRAVINAFSAPTAIQSGWAPLLTQAVERDPEGIVGRAKALKGEGVDSVNTLSDKAVLEALIASVDSVNTPAQPIEIKGLDGKPVARIKQGLNGKYSIELTSKKLTTEQIETAIRKLLKL